MCTVVHTITTQNCTQIIIFNAILVACTLLVTYFPKPTPSARARGFFFGTEAAADAFPAAFLVYVTTLFWTGDNTVFSRQTRTACL